MKVAVTGASGFIGQHVLAELARSSVEVVAVTRTATKLPIVNTTIKIVEMDISCPDSNSFNRLGRPDVLIHLAWDGLPNYKSLHHFETELPRQYTFLKALVDAGLPSLLVAGTCFEYGMRSGPLSEDMDTFPGNPYGYAKDALRKQMEFLQSTTAFTLTWARLFYMYGEGQPMSSLYPLLKNAVQRREPLFNMSGGEQLRDYLPADEVARLLVALAKHQVDLGVVNVSAGTPISVRKLVEGWLDENGWEIELNLGYYPYPDYEPMAFWGDRRYLNKILEEIGDLPSGH